MIYYLQLFLEGFFTMDKNKEKNNDLETIFGMNRVMFFVIVALVCILSISVGIYASVFYKYKEKDPGHKAEIRQMRRQRQFHSFHTRAAPDHSS